MDEEMSSDDEHRDGRCACHARMAELRPLLDDPAALLERALVLLHRRDRVREQPSRS